MEGTDNLRCILITFCENEPISGVTAAAKSTPMMTMTAQMMCPTPGDTIATDGRRLRGEQMLCVCQVSCETFAVWLQICFSSYFLGEASNSTSVNTTESTTTTSATSLVTTLHSATPVTLNVTLIDQPLFVAPINNVTANVGEDATLTCKVRNIGSHRVTG